MKDAELARSTAARRRQQDLQEQLRTTADAIAQTEEEAAELFDELAITQPARAARLHRMAEDARKFAEHERRQSQQPPPGV